MKFNRHLLGLEEDEVHAGDNSPIVAEPFVVATEQPSLSSLIRRTSKYSAPPESSDEEEYADEDDDDDGNGSSSLDVWSAYNQLGVVSRMVRSRSSSSCHEDYNSSNHDGSMRWDRQAGGVSDPTAVRTLTEVLENGACYIPARPCLASKPDQQEDLSGFLPVRAACTARMALRDRVERLRTTSFRHALAQCGTFERASELRITSTNPLSDSSLARKILQKVRQDEQNIRNLEMRLRTNMQESSGRVELQLSGVRNMRSSTLTKVRRALDGERAELETARSLLSGVMRFKGDKEIDELITKLQNYDSYLTELDGLTARAARSRSQSDMGELLQCLSVDGGSRSRKLSNQAIVQKALVLVEELKKDELSRKQEEAAASQISDVVAARADAAGAKEEQQRKEKSDHSVSSESGQKERRHLVKEEKEGLIEALSSPKEIYNRIKESADPGVKRIRLGLRKCFAGGFNKVSNDPAKIQEIVRSISEGAQEALAAARSSGWGDEAHLFYCYSIASQIITRAEGDQFDANYYDQAFQYSCIIVDLCKLENRIGDLLRGLLYAACPYAIPKVTFSSMGSDDTELMRAMGMHENEDSAQYFKRMKNMMVLMGVIAQTPASVQGSGSHPFPMERAWEWLATLLNELSIYVLAAGKKANSPKIPHAIGPILDGFLRSVGFDMQRIYGRQFRKLLAVVEKFILPNLQEDVPHLLGPFFDEYHRKGERCEVLKGREALESYRKWGRTR